MKGRYYNLSYLLQFASKSENLKSVFTTSLFLWLLLSAFVQYSSVLWFWLLHQLRVISLCTYRTKKVGGSGKLGGLQTRDAAAHGSS